MDLDFDVPNPITKKRKQWIAEDKGGVAIELKDMGELATQVERAPRRRTKANKPSHISQEVERLRAPIKELTTRHRPVDAKSHKSVPEKVRARS